MNIIKELEKNINEIIERSEEKKPSGTKISNVNKEKKVSYGKFLSDEKKGLIEKAREGAFKSMIGRVVVSTTKIAETQFKTSFQKLSTFSSGITNKMFGKLFDDLRPLIDSIKIVSLFVKATVFTLVKTFFSITKLISAPFIKFISLGFSKLIESFKIKKKKDVVEQKEKQVDVLALHVKLLRWILVYSKILMKNTAARTIKGRADYAERQKRRKETASKLLSLFKSKQEKKGQEDDSSNQKGRVQKVLDLGKKKLGDVGGFLKSFVGGAMGKILGISVVLLGGYLFKNVYDKFFKKEGNDDTGLIEKVFSPVSKFITDTLFPFITDFTINYFTPAIVDVIKDLWNLVFGGGEGRETREAKRLEKERNKLVEQRSKETDPEKRKEMLKAIEEIDKKTSELFNYGNRRDSWTGFATQSGAVIGGIAGGIIGFFTKKGVWGGIKVGVVVGGVGMNRLSNKIYDRFSPMEPTVAEVYSGSGFNLGGVVTSPSNTNLITSRFGGRNTGLQGASTNHKGIDFRGQMGAPVFAMDSGVVVGRDSSWGGVTIDHGNGIQSKYLHLSRAINKGASVQSGQVIGAVGETRPVNKIPMMSPHLHFSVLRNGAYVDPDMFLREHGVSNLGYKNGSEHLSISKNGSVEGLDGFSNSENKAIQKASEGGLFGNTIANLFGNLFSIGELSGKKDSTISSISQAEKTTSVDIGNKRKDVNTEQNKKSSIESNIPMSVVSNPSVPFWFSTNLTEMVELVNKQLMVSA